MTTPPLRRPLVVLLAIAAGTLAGSAAAQHQGDVQLQVADGQIVTGAASLDGSDNTVAVTIGDRVFTSVLQSNFRGSNPGFNTDPTGSPVLPAGVEGFPAAFDLSFDLLPITLGATVANFFYWDAADPGEVDFGQAPANVHWNVFDDDFDLYTADGGADLVPGGLIGTSSGSGRLHSHLIYAVDDGDGNVATTPDEGVYLASLRARGVGFETSNPFFFVHRSPGVDAGVAATAAAWVDANYDALIGLEPTLGGDFNLDGSVDAADYTVWRDGLGVAYTPADYGLWSNNYGATAAVSAAVPEPATALLAALAAVACLPPRGARG